MTSSSIRPCVAVILFSLIISFQLSAAQGTYSRRYVVSHWGMEEGLPQSSVNDILQSKDGYLWLATFGGLVRFDGVSFTTFDRSNTKGMRSDRILALYEDRQGAIWLSTEDGFLRFQSGECSTFLLSQGTQNYSPHKVAEDSRGVMWLSVNAQPYRFSHGTFIRVPVINDSLLAAQALRDHRGIWLADGQEILRTYGDSVVQIMDLRSVLKHTIQDFIELPKGSGTYFIGTDGDGIVRYKNGKFTFLSEKNGLPSKFVWKFFVDRKNDLWVTCFNGLSMWNGTRFVPFNGHASSKDIAITAFCEDGEGDYWLGDQSSGLYKVRPSIISTIGEERGLQNEKMLSLSRLKNGTMLFATNCGGVYEWKNNKAVYSTVNAFLPNLCVWSVFEDSKRNIWFGSMGLYRSSSLTKRGIVLDSTYGFDGIDVFAMTEDSRHHIWIGCLNGVYVYDGKKFHRYSAADGLSYNDTRVFFEDKDGAMWIGTSAGLNVFRDNSIRHVDVFGTGKGTARSSDPYIRAIYQDADGTMWFGSYGNGLLRLKNGKFSFITTRDGLFDNIVSTITKDQRGNFWMGCNRGIFRVREKELNDLCDGVITRVHSYSYGIADGMASAETNGGFQPATIMDSAGHIYFPTVSGVAVVSTRNVLQNDLPPPVKVEALFSENHSLPVRDAVTLPYDSSGLEIHYAALSYAHPAKNRFKYVMEGLDKSWVNAGSRRSAFYWGIPPGSYTFTVIGSNNDGVWNTAGASLRVTVLPPFWMTWWFRTLAALLFLSVGPSIYYVRVTALKKEKRVKEQFAEQLINSQEQERRRIAMELHDAIGQQILVVKNRAEMALKTVNDPKQTGEQLHEITRSMISAMNDVRAISHDLRPVHLEQFGLTDTLANLCDQLKEASGIEWASHIDGIDGVIPREKEIHFYRIVQEGINNILKHSSAAQATIMIRRSKEELTASLWDNGKGFDLLAAIGRGGMGLEGIQERAKSLGGTCEIKSHPGEGTTVRVIIPVRKV
ncbi:MAG: hypothetical protein KGJ59_05220 [Bacteroidota bacterium]|nr:hypothetical protein [Bacteroidota bacterium]